MNYNNYEGKIVEEFGVCLEGWPVGEVRNPANVGGRANVTKLFGALKNKTCHWIRLTDEELRQRIDNNHERVAAGEEVYKPRRAKKAATKSTATVEKDGAGGDVDESADESVHQADDDMDQ
jgi:hypothetical protein